MINVFVGDTDATVATAAKKYDNNAFLLDKSNYQVFLNTQYVDITVYTSLGDLPKITKSRSIFFEVLSKADNIFYSPPLQWSDYNITFQWESQQRLTEYYLYLINLEKNNVSGLNLDYYASSGYLELAEQRSTNNRTLWVAGCSISHGVGVNQEQRYGEIVSKGINLPVVHLTKIGSSVEWAADSILRSDINSGDIVVWGITNEHRAPCAVNGKVIANRDPVLLLDETRLYHAVTKVYEVVNFCRKLSVNLVLLPIISSENLNLLIQHLPEYYQLPYRPWHIDKGTNGIHPGPLQHQEWADLCINLLKSKV